MKRFDNRLISESIDMAMKSVIGESFGDNYQSQRDDEKNIFFQGLRNNSAEYSPEEHMIYVEIKKWRGDNYYRYITYTLGEDRLIDYETSIVMDKLTVNELQEIASWLERKGYDNDEEEQIFIAEVGMYTNGTYESIRRAVKPLVREAVMECMKGMIEEKKKNSKPKSEGKKNRKISATKMKQVLQLLNADKVDMAAIARKLYPTMNDDTRRSLISKKSRGERPLNDREANDIYHMLRTAE